MPVKSLTARTASSFKIKERLKTFLLHLLSVVQYTSLNPKTSFVEKFHKKLNNSKICGFGKRNISTAFLRASNEDECLKVVMKRVNSRQSLSEFSRLLNLLVLALLHPN